MCMNGTAVPIKLVEKQVLGQIWPPGGSLLRCPGLEWRTPVESNNKGTTSGTSKAPLHPGRMAEHLLQLSVPPPMEVRGNFLSGALGQDFGAASQRRGREWMSPDPLVGDSG